MLPLHLNRVHHISIICSDYQRSKKFYTEVLGFTIIGEHFREERHSYKLDLALNGIYILELFSFPDPPGRLTLPEAVGLRHIAFEVDDLEDVVESLRNRNYTPEEIRTDPFTGKRFTFFFDPDNLPIEIYEK